MRVQLKVEGNTTSKNQVPRKRLSNNSQQYLFTRNDFSNSSFQNNSSFCAKMLEDEVIPNPLKVIAYQEYNNDQTNLKFKLPTTNGSMNLSNSLIDQYHNKVNNDRQNMLNQKQVKSKHLRSSDVLNIQKSEQNNINQYNNDLQQTIVVFNSQPAKVE